MTIVGTVAESTPVYIAGEIARATFTLENSNETFIVIGGRDAEKISRRPHIKVTLEATDYVMLLNRQEAVLVDSAKIEE